MNNKQKLQLAGYSVDITTLGWSIIKGHRRFTKPYRARGYVYCYDSKINKSWVIGRMTDTQMVKILTNKK